jgi:lipid-A-disaccharide synthase
MDERVASLKVFVVVGEASGDQLGAKLMRALGERVRTPVFLGTAGDAMAAAGMRSLFPLTDIAVMGFVPVIKRLPLLIRRVRTVVAAIVAARPDVLVIIDSPDFTHAVAKRVRRKMPQIPIVDYVCPSVWAWRPGRAKTMRSYVDHVLALLPFEPEALKRLHGPACTYVGHPLIERLPELRTTDFAENLRRQQLLVLPGSRRSEIDRLMPVFGEALAVLLPSFAGLDIVLPAVSHHRARIENLAAKWSVKPRVIAGEAAKFAAFRSASAALAASGTVTLELALAGVPMVVAYAVSSVEAMIARRMIKVPSIVLPNLILEEKAIPQLLQEECNPAAIARHLAPLLRDSDERRLQHEALSRIDGLMLLPAGEEPSGRAADIILSAARKWHRRSVRMGR